LQITELVRGAVQDYGRRRTGYGILDCLDRLEESGRGVAGDNGDVAARELGDGIGRVGRDEDDVIVEDYVFALFGL
jgi:hypothetical protein